MVKLIGVKTRDGKMVLSSGVMMSSMSSVRSMACSSVVEQLTVNQPVAGSNPAMPVWGNSSVG